MDAPTEQNLAQYLEVLKKKKTLKRSYAPVSPVTRHDRLSRRVLKLLSWRFPMAIRRPVTSFPNGSRSSAKYFQRMTTAPLPCIAWRVWVVRLCSWRSRSSKAEWNHLTPSLSYEKNERALLTHDKSNTSKDIGPLHTPAVSFSDCRQQNKQNKKTAQHCAVVSVHSHQPHPQHFSIVVAVVTRTRVRLATVAISVCSMK